MGIGWLNRTSGVGLVCEWDDTWGNPPQKINLFTTGLNGCTGTNKRAKPVGLVGHLGCVGGYRQKQKQKK